VAPIPLKQKLKEPFMTLVELPSSASASYERGSTDQPLLEETIGERLRRITERYGEREALVVRHQDYRASYRELSEQVALAARALITGGVRKGDRVGIWAPNRYEWVIVQYATARVGAILVTINPAHKAGELQYALRKAGVSFLLMARGFRGADYIAMLDQVRGECPALRDVVVLDDEWEAFLAEADWVDERELREREASLDPSDPINIQYTSGTTGFPKGATLSHRNILNNGHFTAQVLRYSERDRVCVPVPFYHTFGMVLGNLVAMSHGACVVVPGESFDPDDVLRAVQAERCTSLYGVPTMFIAELAHPTLGEFDLGSLRTGIMAGAPCPVEVMKQVRSRMHMEEVTIACGMTETSPLSTQTSVDDPVEKRVTTVGRVHPHVEVKIVDPTTGQTVPRGTAGEQCTRGYSVMLGYWEDPDGTARAIDADGWMHSGDLAVMDDEGYVSIVGRLKDMIIRGGENIYPREVEEFLYTLPEIDLVEVIGVPSQRYGEEVMAWVRLRADASVTAEDLIAACRGRIATYKIPRYWKFVESSR
jgi:fatty-acyl-CoA synthase